MVTLSNSFSKSLFSVFLSVALTIVTYLTVYNYFCLCKKIKKLLYNWQDVLFCPFFSLIRKEGGKLCLDETDSYVNKAHLLAKVSSEPISDCSAFAAEVKIFVLHTQDILLQLMWRKISIACFYVKHAAMGKNWQKWECNKLRVQFNKVSNECHKKLFEILLDLYLLIFLRKGVVSIVTATLHGSILMIPLR